ncbi:response regulator [Deinococcus sp. KNUC1210]|uniref:response regulator n=1 Tax=Deinococcus sp. KNUC1210 TaxID=2917691 RepID=UPI00351CBFF8
MPGELILIVEDDARIADLLERGLHSAEYRTERAGTGGRALELWRASRPNLILLDLMIPAPDGLEVLRRIRQESDVPVLILSARVEEIEPPAGAGTGGRRLHPQAVQPPRGAAAREDGAAPDAAGSAQSAGTPAGGGADPRSGRL